MFSKNKNKIIGLSNELINDFDFPVIFTLRATRGRISSVDQFYSRHK